MSVKVILPTGQSLMSGYLMNQGTLPSHLAAFNFGQSYVWDGTYWGVITPGVNTGSPQNPQMWASWVETAYLLRVSDPNGIHLFVPSTKGETGVTETPTAVDWSPASINEMFDITTAKIAAAKAALDVVNPGLFASATERVVLWDGGQSDAYSANLAMGHKMHMDDLLDGMFSDWGATKVVMARPDADLPFGATVSRAQYELAEEKQGVYSFGTQGLPTLDGVHRTADAHVLVGGRFFDEAGWGF